MYIERTKTTCPATFDEGNPNPTALNEFIAEAKKLDSKAMSYILGIMKELNSKK